MDAMKLLSSLLLTVAVFTTTASAQIMLDLDDAGSVHTQAGFDSIVVTSGAGPNTINLPDSMTVTLQAVGGGGMSDRDRGAQTGDVGFTFSDLYRDVWFAGGSGDIAVTISGLDASQDYGVRFYTYDAAITGTTRTTITNTTGAGGDVSGFVDWTGSTTFTSNNQYSTELNVISSGAGELTFTVSSAILGGSGTNNGTLSGIVLVPEPSTASLAGLALLGWAARRRRRA